MSRATLPGRGHRYTKPEHLEQFISRKRTGCWLWIGPKGHLGQPQVTYQGLRQSARNVLWEIAHDELVSDGVRFRAKCKTKGCVNPAHVTPENLPDEVWDRLAMEYVTTGCTHKAIAERIGYSRENVTRRINQALERMEQQKKGAGDAA